MKYRIVMNVIKITDDNEEFIVNDNIIVKEFATNQDANDFVSYIIRTKVGNELEEN